MRIVSLISLSALLVSGCIPSPKPQPVRPAAPRPVPAPLPAPAPLSNDWRDWPITPGNWSYRADGSGSTALFGTGNTAFSLRCDKGANVVYLSRAGDARGTGFTIRTSTVTRALPTQATGTTPPSIAALLSADDRLLDAIGYSRGRFVVEAPPLGTLVIPAWPEILRVVEDCRN